jgi:hypothetical protein
MMEDRRHFLRPPIFSQMLQGKNCLGEAQADAGGLWRGPVEIGTLRYISNQRPYRPGPVRLGIFRLPFTTGGKSFTSSYTSVMNRSLLCFVSPIVVAS